MRLALLIAGVLAPLAGAPSALAQPARCDVHILRAPDPVRRVIEARVKREPSCETSIALRVVPTTSGLYLLAHTPSGRTYELVAPDAETAAELVATWATRREAAPAAAQVLPLAPPAIGPPSAEASPAAGAPIDEARLRPAGAAQEHPPGAPAGGGATGQWLALAGILGGDLHGIRGEIDLWSGNGWSAGVAVAYSASEMMNESGSVTLELGDLRGELTAAYTLGRGAVRLRGQVGLGAVRTSLVGWVDAFGDVSYVGANPIGEASAQLQVMLGHDRAWALTGGPTITIYAQSFTFSDQIDMQTADRTLDVAFVGGLRRRL